MCYQSYSEICGLQEQMGVADFLRMARPKSEQDLHHWARRSVQSLDVKELGMAESNEDKNAKVSTTGYASSCRRLEISRVNDIPLGRFTILSAA